MILQELLVHPDRRQLAAASPEADALVEVGALDEAALQDVRFSMVTSSVWLLFDCRGALQIEMGNTAVVVLHNVELLRWTGVIVGPRSWHQVVSWTPTIVSSSLSIRADLHPDGVLKATGSSGEFYVGDVPGCDEAPPNFSTATDAEVRAGLAQWSSEFEPIHGSFLDRAEHS